MKSAQEQRLTQLEEIVEKNSKIHREEEFDIEELKVGMEELTERVETLEERVERNERSGNEQVKKLSESIDRIIGAIKKEKNIK